MPSEFALNRREFLKSSGKAAALAALASGLWPMSGCTRPAIQIDDSFTHDPKSKIYVVSDIHIGDNSYTCWYQKDIHEPFLLRILDEVINRRDEIRELVLLGDVMDFWTYVPERRPPGFHEIAAANPNIFGPTGKLAEVLSALQGHVTVLQGNHDMGFSQLDWNTIRSPEGFSPKLIGNIYQPLGDDSRLILAHGHLYTMFNAPDSAANAPLPVGHYVTRSVANRVRNQLQGSGRTAADLQGQGAPNGTDIGSAFGSILNDTPSAIGQDHDVVTLLLDLARDTCGMKDSTTIILPNGASSSIAEARASYKGLWQRWSRSAGGHYLGDVLALRALESDAESKYLGWFAQRLAIEKGAELVVMGHTHKPIQGLIADPDQGRALCNYYNTGFGCPSTPDMSERSVTFAVIDAELMHAQTMRVKRSGSASAYSYSVERDPAHPDSIVYSPMMDFSTYITIDNTRGKQNLTRETFSDNVGVFVVPPPQVIRAGASATFWIQDKLGIRGSEGRVRYSRTQGPAIDFFFECPSGVLTNNARAAADIQIFARSGRDADWNPQGKVPPTGHPLFVRFVI